MEYKDFIKPGNKVAFIPQSYHPFWGWDFSVNPKVVTIGEYNPYYTDGTPDPTPQNYDAYCFVEIEEDIHGETQIQLDELFGINLSEEEVFVIWGTDRCKVIGKVDSEVENYYILESCGEWIIVDADECEIERDISELSFDELCELRKEIYLGSLYLSDYENSFGIDVNVASDYAEGFICSLQDEYGEEWEKYDTPENFAEFCAA